jgi:hypothetical protein
LLEKQVGEAFGDLLFIASSQSNHCPWVEGFRWPSLRSGLLNPSTQGQIPSANQLSPFELAAVSFCSRPDSTNWSRLTPAATKLENEKPRSGVPERGSQRTS